MLRLILFAICLAILSVHGKNTEEQRTVHLEGLGNVIGEKFWDGEFYEFYGIPYASMPKGRDRYKPPLPPKPWEEEDFIAKRAIVLCYQVYTSNREDEGELLFGEEECLAASYFVPKIATETNLVPVIVFVHSGGYVGGNGNMARFNFLARQDVIVVNINYRLGAHGFACLGTDEVPGNAALKDIVAALRFIKKHIKSFGGDPDNITLAGYSIGASLAEIVALSPQSKGLFSKLLLDSGSSLNPFAVNRHPIETARNIAISVGYEDTDSLEDLNDFYVDADNEDIQGVSRQYFLKNSTFGFTPCIENPNNPEAVLTESPLDILKRGNYGDFALFIGWANMEGISRTSQFEEWGEEMNKHFADFLPADLVFDNEKERDEFIKEVKQYYFDGKPITIDNIQGYVDYFSDSMFRYAIVKSLKYHALHLKRPIYAYEFTYVGKLNTQHNYKDRISGASHRDASAYVLDFHDWTRNYTDMDMRDLMNYVWGDFLKFENPTAYESHLITMKWLKYTTKDTLYLDMGYEFVMKKEPFSKGYQLWDKVYKKHYWNPTRVDPVAYEKASKKNAKAKLVQKKQIDGKPQEPTVQETKPQETKPQETKPQETKPQVTEPQEAKPQVTKPQETKPQETKPPVSKPQETKPQVTEPQEAKPQVTKPQETKPQETKPPVSKPQETKPQETKPQVTKAQETKPQETKPQETKPQVTKPQETKAQETKPQETKPQVTKPRETNPQVTKPQETKAQETKPQETKPQETKAQETKPQETKPAEKPVPTVVKTIPVETKAPQAPSDPKVVYNFKNPVPDTKAKVVVK